MRTFTTLCLLTAGLATLNAQNALDFTASDCAGMEHTLFAELEAGNAVILEFVMMGCQPCIDACSSITNNVLPNTADPSRVKFYSIGFTNSITCAQMNNWKSTNGFSHTVFAGMSAQTTNYGGMGMPTLVVLGGGTAHTVNYDELGHSDSDNPAIIAAINDALASGNSIAESPMTTVGVSPNPTTDVLTISGDTWTNARVLDIQGREVLNARLVNSKLEVNGLGSGAYVLYLTDANGAIGTARFEKK